LIKSAPEYVATYVARLDESKAMPFAPSSASRRLSWWVTRPVVAAVGVGDETVDLEGVAERRTTVGVSQPARSNTATIKPPLRREPAR
jgi:hypothetical protein